MNLSVQVSLHGVPVVDRLVPVRDAVRLGEAEGAEVSFPGADLRVVRHGRQLTVRGRVLVPGQSLELSLGSVEVSLQALERRSWRRAPQGLPDLRLLLATGAMVLLGFAWEVAQDVAQQNPDEVAVLVHEATQEPVAMVATLLRTALEVKDQAALPAPPAPLDTGDWPTATYTELPPAP
ncbi:MAG: hypothetical protein JXX28_11165 [Deltaproteobacteria bacterium]|nr:hypothetical protein [Deltaproteobacteria bacterium]